MSYLLLTGATGLLGRYLTGDLLTSSVRLAVLVRSSKRESAAERVEGIMQFWEKRLGRQLPRPVVLEGDICHPMLGLDDDSIQWVTRNCYAMMHSAASLTFHDDGQGEPWNSNVVGTQNVLQLCEAAEIRQMHYVSTAYVCGLRPGTIYETELDCGQEFRNDYEKSKLHAETLVRNADCFDQLTVYRPAVISGDSQTGYTNTYHGIYLYLRMMSLIVPRQPVGPDGRRHTRLRLPMTGEERRNVVPVDWVSQVMCRLFLQPEAHGHTFHLAPDQCITPGRGMEAGYTYYNSTGVEWVGHQELDPATYNSLEAELLPAITMYNSYERTDPTFDCSNVKRFAGDLPCPPITEQTLHTYIRYGEEDRWGKRRPTRVHLEHRVADVMSHLPSISDTQHASVAVVALDIQGAGGGGWTLHLLDNGDVVCEEGLIGAEVTQMSVETFFDMVEGPVNAYGQRVVDQFFPIEQQQRARA